jgi:hypothetical protein
MERLVCKYVNLIDISTLLGFGIETDAAGIVISVRVPQSTYGFPYSGNGLS